MSGRTTGNGTGIRSTHRRSPDGRTLTVDAGALHAKLDTVAAGLRALWCSALERGDLDEISRLVDASHSVHRALIALGGDNLVPPRTPVALVPRLD
jgi:hypothetical protein